ncbi:5-hydroxytryptamine receptor 1-like [Paramuricea clavata]|uniref:5-hydroxytryptamine receptor 1-like n=1 Tax=Paramuricea clavata TaxID=317549 RepID=A0A6S7L289_PARCT|nr:5-hydroxytryptamine receptor 1-like [Paramuricea clavata]
MEPSFVEQQLNISQSNKTIILGLPWDYDKDTLSVTFPKKLSEEPRKRGILGKLAKVCVPIGLVSPVTLEGKVIYRNACDSKLSWNTPIRESLLKEWLKWEDSLPERVAFDRTLLPSAESWRTNPVTSESSESAAESKIIQSVLATVEDELDVFDELIEKRDLPTTLRPPRSSFAVMFTNQTYNGTWNNSDWKYFGVEYDAFLTQVELAQKIILIVIAILTILGNILVLVVTWREKSLHQPNKYFIAFLAVADLLVGMFLDPLKANELTRESKAQHTMSIHLCRFTVWIDNFALTASIWSLAVISFDRYLKISKPLQYKSKMTTSKSFKIIFSILLASIAFATYAATPYSGSYGILLVGNNLHTYCPSDDNKEKGFYTFLSVAFFLSTVVIMVMYALIFVIAHKRQKMLQNGELGQTWNDRNQRSVFLQDLKVIRMLLVIVGVYILCWFPFVIYSTLARYNRKIIDRDSTSLNYWYSIIISLTVVGLLPLFNSLCNPIIYACLDRKYREAFKNLFQRIICRSNSQSRQPQIGIELRPPRTRERNISVNCEL